MCSYCKPEWPQQPDEDSEDLYERPLPLFTPVPTLRGQIALDTDPKEDEPDAV